ncbi:MAG TPA: DUF4387 domain-containing protein [Candidatus Elarobacter sp.]|nr:DUF4387 domain-containing protein [Candidatus Elarobacter sp.]
MPRVRDVCSHVRSKNAGPFWITIDLFFDGEELYRRYRDDRVFTPGRIAPLFGTQAALVKRFPVDRLNMLKISFPRPKPQGGIVERDMHSGQQYVRVLALELDEEERVVSSRLR